MIIYNSKLSEAATEKQREKEGVVVTPAAHFSGWWLSKNNQEHAHLKMQCANDCTCSVQTANI